jgi:hypothetical protein
MIRRNRERRRRQLRQGILMATEKVAEHLAACKALYRSTDLPSDSEHNSAQALAGRLPTELARARKSTNDLVGHLRVTERHDSSLTRRLASILRNDVDTIQRTHSELEQRLSRIRWRDRATLSVRDEVRDWTLAQIRYDLRSVTRARKKSRALTRQVDKWRDEVQYPAVAERLPGWLSAQLLRFASSILPAGHRIRYAEEFMAELAELDRRSWRAVYALRQIARVWGTRRALVETRTLAETRNRSQQVE